jgi:hypothetical protein
MLLAQSSTRSAAGGIAGSRQRRRRPASLPVPVPVPGEWTAGVGSGQTACVAREAHAPGSYACGTLWPQGWAPVSVGWVGLLLARVRER